MKTILASFIILISSLILTAQSSVPARKNTGEPGDISSFKSTAILGGMEKTTIAQVLIYPNPAVTYVRVSMNSSESTPVQVILLDNIGNKMLEGLYELSAGQNVLTLNLEDLRIKPGVYFLRIQFSDEQFTRKLVIRG